jgi:hypothetical protein
MKEARPAVRWGSFEDASAGQRLAKPTTGAVERFNEAVDPSGEAASPWVDESDPRNERDRGWRKDGISPPETPPTIERPASNDNRIAEAKVKRTDGREDARLRL